MNPTLNRLFHIATRILNSFPLKLLEIIFEWILRFTPLFVLSRLPLSYGIYLKCFCERNRRGSVVLDCGAHIGNCAILFSRTVGPKGRVVCIEPFRDSYLRLEQRIKRLKLKNVIALNKGIWKQSAVLPLDVFENSIACRLASDQYNNPIHKELIQIECLTIDQIANDLNLTKIDLIKMDIEGTEIEALQGAVRTMTELRPQVAIASYHHREGQPTCSEVERILDQYNYHYKTFFPPHLTTCGKPR